MNQVHYVSSQAAFKHLKNARYRLTKQQYYTLKGQILAGNPVGALKGLKKILDRKIRSKGAEHG